MARRASRSSFSSRLDGIPGVGEARKKALMQHFKTLKAIAAVSLDELGAVLPRTTAQAVYDHFHKEESR